MTRILCAWSPHWAIANWRRRAAAPPEAAPQGAELGADLGPETPFALVETVRQARRLAAVDRRAAALGLQPGQKLTDARARVPGLAVAPAEPEADAEALEALVDWCVRYSPAVAADPPDGLFLDVTGVAHLWGGEAGLMADLRARLFANGLPFRLALADTAGAAWALARHGRDGVIAAPEAQAALLAPLPPAALRLEPEATAQIERLGLRRLGQLMDIPRAPLGRRFGAHTLMRLDQALGRAPEALAFRRPPTPWMARLAFFEPVSAPEDMARVTDDVVAELCRRLEAEGRGARRFALAFHRVDGRTLPLEAGLSLAGRDSARIARLFHPRLETVDPGFGVEAVTLCAYEVEALQPRQARIHAGEAPSAEDGLASFVDRLANRLGADRVWRAAPVESHIPEKAVTRIAAIGAETAATPWDARTPRPVRLFRRPEPLEHVYALLPDDPPRRFRWRGRVHDVRRAEGPERIGEDWWLRDIGDVSPTRIRDYYRVEDQDGARFWLFRAGLYADADAPPKWWMHGVFG
ncbi:DNA polymerase Y family protein [Phenylobacterium sp.]|uniref:Y-family DNA polymerase n=1 Tax=Phenylobacterium sp. TaxID=1871053 RepID=UPI00301CEDD5